MNTLDYLAQKFKLDYSQKGPMEIFEINRRIMAETLAELGFNLGVEVGVAAGDHSKVLLDANPKLKLFGIDPYVHYQGYTDYMSERLRWFETKAGIQLGQYPNYVHIKKFSMDAVGDFPDKSLDFVYLDGAHDFKNVAMDICEWEKKVRPDGILFGHDYKRDVKPDFPRHIVDVVCAYTYAMQIRPWFILGQTGHPDGMYREGTRSWMWVVR